MTSLTKVAITTRKIIRYSIYLVIFLIAFRIVWDVSIGVYRRLFPKPPPAPTVLFGKLPPLPFPQKNAPKFEYKVETVEGTLPTLPTQAKVYFMPKTSASLLSLENAKNTSALLGFRSNSEAVSQTVYKFTHPRASATLEMNIVTGVFSVSFDLKSDPSPLESQAPASEIAASQVRSFLSAANLLPKDLTGPVTHEFLKVESQNLVAAVSLSEASLVKINLFRKAIGDLPSLTPNPSEANIWFIVSGSRTRDKQIIAGEYHYFPVDEGQSATYPIKTAQQALDELAAGGGFFASTGLNQENQTVVIRKVYLGYFDAGTYTNFYQPIIVFVGDNGFTAYVPAVTSDYYGE